MPRPKHRPFSPRHHRSRIQALALYLSQVQLLPTARVCQAMKDLLSVLMSGKTLHNWIARCSHHLHPIEEQIKTAVQQGSVLHQETGMYVPGKRH